ncbi:uncharacterized protein [Salmo salar]|uniref:J domain-containing protein n=1 Tax=Salmo salar TaxID=8030 RepID=A0ABM3CSH2_SALSA|nr:uncharacterized protein LOC123726240 [Salmo salar]
MAEVRLKLSNGAYRILQNTYQQLPLRIEGNQAKGAIQATSLLTEYRSGEAQNDHDNTARPGNWTRLPSLGIPDETLRTENSRSLSRLTDGGFKIGFCHDLISKCGEGVLQFGSAWRNNLSDSEDIRVLDSASRWFHLSSPHLADTQVHVIASRASSWIRNGLVTATITQTRREQRRSLCMVRFAIRESSFSLRQSHEQLFVRAYGNGNMSEPLYKSRTAYYEILEVSPTATQAQIKTAYYKQSFVYHPDKNAGSEEATNRFSDISEAYNVLGNKGLRKKYDRGILSQGDVTGASKPSAKDTKSSSSQPTREARQTSALGIDSKNIFDFDNFIKSHYKSQLLKEEELRVRKEEIMRKKEAIKDQEMGKMMEMAVGVLVIIAVSILVNLKRGGN